jgi:hypothetical protein
MNAMAIYRIPYKIEGKVVVKADSLEEAERGFWQFTQSELGAIGAIEWVGDPARDFEAEAKDSKLLGAIFREASNVG